MSAFYLVTYVVASADLERSRITDLDILLSDGTPVLVSTTRLDGVLASWQIVGGNLSAVAETAYTGGDFTGGTGSVMTLGIAGGAGVLTGGGDGGVLQTLTVGSNAGLGPPVLLPPGSYSSAL